MEKIISTILLMLFLSAGLLGCYDDFSEPLYNIGNKVMIGEELKGTVINVRNWSGASKGNTSDYYVMIGEGAAVWYDEEVLNRAN